MQIIRRLFVSTMTAVGIVASIAAAILVVNHHRSESLREMENVRATAWENLGATFDVDLPTEAEDLPGLARIVDSNLVDGSKTRDVIDEELSDATPEEREIWCAELARHSPDEIREILGIHKRLSATLGNTHVGDVEFVAASASAPKPLSEVEIASANRIPTDAPVDADAHESVETPVSTDALELIQSAIEANHSAEQVILNNIANANTVGFKRSRALFGDLPYRQVTIPGPIDQQGLPAPTGIALGAGVKLLATQLEVSQGRLRHTQEPLDLAIQGDGYFQINDGNRFVYTRTGTFTINSNGVIVLVSKDRGRPLEPSITVPQDTTKITISSAGSISVFQAGQVQFQQVGQLHLTRFISPQGLIARGENLYEQSGASGNPLITTPGQDGLGEIQQGYLEEANVVVADELAELRRMQEHLKTLRKLRADFASASPAP